MLRERRRKRAPRLRSIRGNGFAVPSRRATGTRNGARLWSRRQRTWSEEESSRDGEAGFTLVELLVVLVILSLVMGLVAPRVLGYLSDARVRSTKLQIESLASALSLFFLDAGRYPSASEGLQSLISQGPRIDGWNGPYLQQAALPVDAWGRPYEYKAPGEQSTFAITSLGADGKPGGEDDAADLVSQ